jgi:hypothetical protein
MKKKLSDYEGNYKIARAPTRMVPHNAETWAKIEREIAKYGVASFERLTALCIDHRHGSKSAIHPYQFITYCIQRKWLRRIYA